MLLQLQLQLQLQCYATLTRQDQLEDTIKNKAKTPVLLWSQNAQLMQSKRKSRTRTVGLGQNPTMKINTIVKSLVKLIDSHIFIPRYSYPCRFIPPDDYSSRHLILAE